MVAKEIDFIRFLVDVVVDRTELQKMIHVTYLFLLRNKA